MGWLIGATNFPGAWYASLTEVSLPSPKLIIGGHLRRVKACSVVENDFLTLCRQLIEIAVLGNETAITSWSTLPCLLSSQPLCPDRPTSTGC